MRFLRSLALFNVLKFLAGAVTILLFLASAYEESLLVAAVSITLLMVWGRVRAHLGNSNPIPWDRKLPVPILKTTLGRVPIVLLAWWAVWAAMTDPELPRGYLLVVVLGVAMLRFGWPQNIFLAPISVLLSLIMLFVFWTHPSEIVTYTVPATLFMLIVSIGYLIATLKVWANTKDYEGYDKEDLAKIEGTREWRKKQNVVVKVRRTRDGQELLTRAEWNTLADMPESPESQREAAERADYQRRLDEEDDRLIAEELDLKISIAGIRDQAEAEHVIPGVDFPYSAIGIRDRNRIVSDALDRGNESPMYKRVTYVDEWRDKHWQYRKNRRGEWPGDWEIDMVFLRRWKREHQREVGDGTRRAVADFRGQSRSTRNREF